MDKPTTKQTRKSYKLNPKQILKLKLIFKFRFVTADLLAEHRKVTREAINTSLKVLLEKGYVDRFYDKTYKLRGKPAIYYLTTKSLRYFRQNSDYSKKAIHAMYKNPIVGEAFVQHNLNIFSIYLRLRSLYPNTFLLFSRSEALGDDYLAELSPDLYLSRKRFSNSRHNYLIFYDLSNIQYFIVKKRINQHIKLLETIDASIEGSMTSLIVCDGRVEARLIKYICNRPGYYYIDDQGFHILITTKEAILCKNEHNKAIWKNVIEPDKPVAI